MAFPAGWPPRTASGQKSLRFYLTGTCTANFEDNAFLFSRTDTPVSDMVFASASGSAVDITSAGSNLPAMEVGTEFEVRDHSTNNGLYKVTTVTASTSNYTVESLGEDPANATTEAASIRITAGNPYAPLPVVNPGESKTVTLDSNPMGGGQSDVGAAAPMIYSEEIIVTATTAAVEISFDGVNIHGSVPAGETRHYGGRREAGIAVRGVGATFAIEAW